MLERVNYLLLFTGVLLVTTFSCNNEPKKEVDEKLLLGDWQIENAIRNGKPTRLLQNTYFTFLTDSTFRSNIFQEGRELKYSLDFQNIEIKTPNNPTLKIDSLSNSVLYLSGEVQSQKLKLFFVKSIESGE